MTIIDLYILIFTFLDNNGEMSITSRYKNYTGMAFEVSTKTADSPLCESISRRCGTLPCHELMLGTQIIKHKYMWWNPRANVKLASC